MNANGSYNYQEPLAARNDNRVTSSITQFQRDDQFPMQEQTPFPNIPRIFEDPRVMSEQRSQYTFKVPDLNVMRNPTVAKAVFMKSYAERKFRNPPKPLPPPSSTTSRFHNWKTIPQETQINAAYMPVVVAPNNSIQINRIKPGYAKYLDTSATTTNSAYVEYPFNDLGIGSKDHITFYNWNKGKFNVSKRKETQGEKYTSAECSKRQSATRRTVKAVPYGGQLSEFKSSFGIVPSVLTLDLRHIKTRLVNYDQPMLRFESSNSIYGKEKRTEAYI